jgi:hypothetical protein
MKNRYNTEYVAKILPDAQNSGILAKNAHMTPKAAGTTGR